MIPDEDDLLRAGHAREESVFERLGRDVVAGAENEEIFDTASDAPVAGRVHFSLIASM